MVTQQVPWSEHPFLKIGQRVRIRGGSLEGVEGVLLSRNGDRTLIISVDAIQRSLAVRVEGYDVEASVKFRPSPCKFFCKELPSWPKIPWNPAQILLVSKERSARDLRLDCRRAMRWQLETAGSGWEALERVQAGPGPDLILLDLMRGDSDGLHTLRWLRRVRPDLPVLVLAGSDDAQSEDWKRSAWGRRIFWCGRCGRSSSKPRSGARSFYAADSVESEIVTDEIEQIGDDMFFVAASPTMRKLRAQAELLAQVSAPVLISGENGSGKELAARLIHKLSVRSGFRFLKINCATLPGDVLESELFGMVNGNGRHQARQTGTVPERHAVSR